MRILFLDIDGVLNSAKYDAKCAITSGDLAHFDPVAAVRVFTICQETGASIVLSSTWRFFPDYVDALKRAGLPVIDGTPRHDAFGTRAEEIAGWLAAHQLDAGNGAPIDFVIVDDESDAGVGYEARFVQTDPRVGLTAADAAAIVGLFTAS